MIPIEDASASDGPSEVAADATDASTSETAPSVADGSIDATDASAPTGPTDSSSAADVPMAVPLYGAAMLLDE
jgi:hypothetical protein